MERAVLVYATFPNISEAEAIGRLLVEQRLAACANILPGMISHYRWKGAVERAEEIVMIAKTRASLADEVTATLRKLHSYETPAIVVIPLESAEPNYLAWIMEATQH